MTGAIWAYGLLAALAIALLFAAFTDLRSRVIENWLTIGMAAAAPLFWWASGLARVARRRAQVASASR
jgi:prepilin peptidase CpaA